MTRHSEAFIDLDRTFSKILINSDVSDDTDLSGGPSRRGELHWPDLLSLHRVVLLSEAGSGKTAEIRNVTCWLRSEGKSAFFLRIENVMSELEDAFEEGTFEEFESWLTSDTEGWLLLDSVDEARLGDPREFERAIRKLGRLTKSTGAKAHILITGRSTAWRASTDLAICNKAFEFEASARRALPSKADGLEGTVQTTTSEAEPNVSFLVVTLDDIHGEQIDRFLEATGVKDIKAFRTAVERREAESLTTRPLDFLELVDFWHEHHRIGTRLELMKSSISRRLEERDQNRAEFKPTAPEKLRKGARLIAAATTLGQISAICVPDGDANKNGIPVRSVLRDWNDAEVGALLSRPIFEPGIYGTVRFHHRTVREYLTAEWLHELICSAASRVKIENLFFRTQYGLQVINPSMRPVLPWLVLLDERIRTRLEDLAPEVFFEGGDPSQLPLSTRRNILRKACAQLAQPAHSWAITDYSAVQRFAHHDLAEDINELLVLYRSNDDIVWFLLRMVWHGEVVDALAEVKKIALSSQNKHTRLAAMRAVIDLGTSQDLADLRLALLAGDSKVNREWLAELVDELPLDSEWLPWLLQAIERTAKKERFSGRDTLAMKLSSLAGECPPENLSVFIHGIGALLKRTPLENQGFNAVSKKFGWLAEIAGIAALRLLQARDPFALDESVLSILSMLAQAHIYDERDTRELGEKLREIVPTWPELDFTLFWYDVAVARRGQVHREPVTQVWQLLGFQPFWSLNKENFSLACEQIVSREDMQDRLIALSMAFNIYLEHAKPPSWVIQLRQATECDTSLHTVLETLLNPPKRELEKWEIINTEWKEKAAQREAEEVEHRRSWQEGLAANVALINSPEPGVITRRQVYLLERIRESSPSSNTWGSNDWPLLIAEFCLPVAQAFRNGAMNFWRGYCPTLPSQGAAANSTPYQVILGLIGLAIEAKEEPSLFAQMSGDNAQNAARYGLLELNGFPEWLPKLFALHPILIKEIVVHEILYELNAPHLESGGYRILQRLRWGGDWMYEELSAPLMARLEQPINDIKPLQLVLSIVQDSSICDDVLGALACRRALTETNPNISPTWYAVWIGTHPFLAISALATRIDSLQSNEKKAKFAMLCLIALVGDRTASRCRQNYKTVEHAKALYLLTHTYVRIADDIDRAGKGVYSPELRDDAQHARDGLLAFIRETPGKEAFLALLEIAKSHPSESLRPWSELYAQQKATTDSQTPPWEPEKVMEFHDCLESKPSTHRELWKLAVDRLNDLKRDLEDGDSSIADILLLAEQETAIRKFIGGWLRTHAAGRYSIPQEEQLADDKRPDFRVHGCNNFDAPVPVELKLADRWSGPKLLERLENQLGRDYLRDFRSSCGIFLLVNHGSKKGWALPGKKVAFKELINELQQQWCSLAPNFPNIEDVEVIGIDLTARRGVAAVKAIKKNQAKLKPGK
ncbi:NACHT domain-containing protein [Pseudomonas syringae]|uniref:NACHT domain-containing protein n=1 Tax=Pseudomonas syringae TaxID=317 RepID=UPI003F82958C